MADTIFQIRGRGRKRRKENKNFIYLAFFVEIRGEHNKMLFEEKIKY